MNAGLKCEEFGNVVLMMGSALTGIPGRDKFGHLLEDLEGFPAGFGGEFLQMMVNKNEVLKCFFFLPLPEIVLVPQGVKLL